MGLCEQKAHVSIRPSASVYLTRCGGSCVHGGPCEQCSFSIARGRDPRLHSSTSDHGPYKTRKKHQSYRSSTQCAEDQRETQCRSKGSSKGAGYIGGDSPTQLETGASYRKCLSCCTLNLGLLASPRMILMNYSFRKVGKCIGMELDAYDCQG